MRRLLWLLILPVLVGIPNAALPMEFEERQALDVSSYVVTDPMAGYFDVAERRAYLKTTTSPILRAEIEKLRSGVSCRDVMELPVVDYEIILPGFYVDHDAWERLAVVFQTFEDTVSNLAAAQMVADDTYHADCLVDFLTQWASRRAFEDFYYTTNERQSWYQVESALFAAAMALSTVRDLVAERREDLAVIDGWMLRIARRHSAISGLPSDSCCNNHFYRRSVYAIAVGIMNSDDELFQFGVRAIFSALSDVVGDGALKRELTRGRRAVHYQNFGTMYLIFLAEMIQRQGYDIYNVEYNGHTLHDIVETNLRFLAEPAAVAEFGVTTDQDLFFVVDDQYFAWMEAYMARFHDERLQKWLDLSRPAVNRSLGGHATLYFYEE